MEVWAIALILAAPLETSPIYVDASALGQDDGTSWENAFSSLQDALRVASAGDQVWVAQGTYHPDRGQGQVRGDRWASFLVPDGVGVHGGFLGDERALWDRPEDAPATVLSGDLNQDDPVSSADNSFHVVTLRLAGPGTMLDRLSIIGGNADGSGLNSVGGGVILLASSPTLVECRIADNQAIHGAGAFSISGSLILDRVAIQRNTTTRGGAGWYAVGSSLMVTASEILDNSADQGGAGFYVEEGTSRFRDCRFERNHAGEISTGGAILSLDSLGETEILNCHFSANQAFRGAAISMSGDRLVVSSSEFRDNAGGAVETNEAELHVTDCVFARNEGVAINVRGFLERPRIEIFDSRFTSNFGSSGGAVSLGAGWGGIARCVFEANGAGLGGAVSVSRRDDFFIVGSTFRRNWAFLRGGAVWGQPAIVGNCVFIANFSLEDNGGAVSIASASPGQIANCTFIGNDSNQGIGGALDAESDVLVDNCIFWQNSDSVGTLDTSQVSFANPLQQPRQSCIQGLATYVGNGNTGLDPRFLDSDGADDILGTADDNLLLATDSPCVDAGSNELSVPDVADVDQDMDEQEAMAQDILGRNRFADLMSVPDLGIPGYGYDQVVDMGAHEARDCNENGVADAEELFLMPGRDCDQNGILDECEPWIDCNGNGVHDSCDILFGGSRDLAPRNGIPDECEQPDRTQSWKPSEP